MTKDQKSLFKKLKKDKHRRAFLEMLLAQQAQMGKYKHWQPAYQRKCLKKGAKDAGKIVKLVSAA